MDDLTVRLDTLTPLWTGGVGGTCDRLHETGLIGSLRWWYEAIVRGLGGEVCNPTGPARGRCNYEKHGRVCDACRLFGATGWSRLFRMEIGGGEHLFPSRETARITAPGGRRGWYFGAPLVSSEEHPIKGIIRQLRGGDVTNDLAVVAAVISRWSGLGAKTQHGWGVVDLALQDGQGNTIIPDVDAFVQSFPGDTTTDRGLPSLGNLFFARLFLADGVPDDWWNADDARLGEGIKDRRSRERWRLDKGLSVPIAPAVKYKLRYGQTVRLQDDGEAPVSVLPSLRKREQADRVFGRLNPNYAAMLNISNAHKHNGRWQFRLWGWFPEQGTQHGIHRSNLMRELCQLVTTNNAFWDGIFGPQVVDLSQTVWRELDRTGHGRNKPACATPPTTVAAFLRCLLA